MEGGSQVTLEHELVMLLEDIPLSSWHTRKRRLERISPEVAAQAIIKANKGQPLSWEEYLVANLGFLPRERQRVERMLASTERAKR